MAMRCFDGWGYREIQTPLLHFFDALKPGLDAEQVERCFRFVDRAGHLVVLRPDVTPVIAKVFAVQLANRPLPLRVCYANKVVRVERAFAQKRLETYQIGIEQLGGEEPMADIEVILVAMEVLEQLELPDFQISLADHRLARHLLEATGAPSRIREEVREAVVARDRHQVREILTKLGAREHYIEAVATLADLGGGRDQLDRLAELLPHDRELQERLEILRKINETFNQLGYRERLRLQLGELGGASYYSGISFSIVCEGASGKIGRGGRYDHLVAQYGESTPAVGLTFYAEPIVELLAPTAVAPDSGDKQADSVAVDVSDPLPGLRAALRRRTQKKSTRLVFENGEND